MKTRKEYDRIKVRFQNELHCPFCPENKDISLILWEGKYWTIRYNRYPYLWLDNHFLVFPNRHLEFTCELDSVEWWEMKEVETWMKNYYWEASYFSFIRQVGKVKSVKHLHYHYLPWELPAGWIEGILKRQKIGGIKK